MKNRCRARKRIYEDNLDATGHFVICSKRAGHRGEHRATETAIYTLAVWPRTPHPLPREEK